MLNFEINLIHIMIAGSLIAAAGGVLGTFALLRRMALVGDALSHVALPGIALAIIFNFNPLLGSLACLILGTTLIWAVEHKTKLPVDTLVGIFFTLALAIGAIITPDEDIMHALFGDIATINAADFLIASGASLAIIIALLVIHRRLTLTMISTDLALSLGANPHVLEFLFLMIFALTVAIGIKFTGALLMGSIIIIPAAAARNLAVSMHSYMALSAFFGVVSAASGIAIANYYALSPGPVFVLISGAIFFISIFFRR
jgi:ABC-type Mn2+/Zn2+ transport system permease subunit